MSEFNPFAVDATNWVSSNDSADYVTTTERCVLFNGGHGLLDKAERAKSIAQAEAAAYEYLGESRLSIEAGFSREASASWAIASYGVRGANVSGTSTRRKIAHRSWGIEASGESVGGSALQYHQVNRTGMYDAGLRIKLDGSLGSLSGYSFPCPLYIANLQDSTAIPGTPYGPPGRSIYPVTFRHTCDIFDYPDPGARRHVARDLQVASATVEGPTFAYAAFLDRLPGTQNDDWYDEVRSES